MIKVYTFDAETASVVERECESFGFPHKTTSGEVMYENTHFLTKREAHEKLLREINAGLSLGARERERVRKRLDTITRELADDAERLVRAKDALAAFEREEQGK